MKSGHQYIVVMAVGTLMIFILKTNSNEPQNFGTLQHYMNHISIMTAICQLEKGSNLFKFYLRLLLWFFYLQFGRLYMFFKKSLFLTEGRNTINSFRGNQKHFKSSVGFINSESFKNSFNPLLSRNPTYSRNVSTLIALWKLRRNHFMTNYSELDACCTK